MVTIKDTTLIKSFNEGDPMAFKVIFDRYYKILCSYTYHFIRTPYAVDDIVQDIFWPYGTDGKNLIVSKKSVLFFLSPHVTLALIMPNMNK